MAHSSAGLTERGATGDSEGGGSVDRQGHVQSRHQWGDCRIGHLGRPRLGGTWQREGEGTTWHRWMEHSTNTGGRDGAACVPEGKRHPHAPAPLVPRKCQEKR